MFKHWKLQNYEESKLGSRNFTQVTDLVGIYIHFILGRNVTELAGSFYRDDTSFAIRNLSNRKLELYK